jgi:hypothetical protein
MVRCGVIFKQSQQWMALETPGLLLAIQQPPAARRPAASRTRAGRRLATGASTRRETEAKSGDGLASF